MIKRFLALLLALLAVILPAAAEDAAAADGELPAETTAREEFISAIIEEGHRLFIQADGKWQRAHKKGDIYICRNFVTYVFKQTAGDYCMEEYPEVKLAIPSNMPAEQTRPYGKGYCWENMSAGKGNPFEIAAQFKYDDKLSKQENMELAMEFMRQVRRGDFFQMNASYQWGTGPHSAIMIADYDAENDTVHWMDSNMITKKTNGINYGKVQYDAVKEISWWAEAFCSKRHGATIYRLREDIMHR